MLPGRGALLANGIPLDAKGLVFFVGLEVVYKRLSSATVLIIAFPM